ncbi:MAG TPA: PQQ-dependent sugar dehydrogenase [Alphaproteobacteria bacterium]|nr:PQQ-dependent sugar dehydrogenase [Alphaproteobacteria bacterium]
MTTPIHTRALIMAGLLAGLFAYPGLSSAQQQQPAATPAPLPSPTTNSVLMDAPNSPEAQKLAPVAPPPIATAADKIQLDKLKVPKGFKLEVYASGMVNARSMARGDKGTIFVSTRLLDHIYAVTDKNGKREVIPLYKGLFRPNGLAFKDGTLYIAELNKISKVPGIEDHLTDPPKPTLIYDNLPSDEAHGWKYLAIGPDNKLYFNVGAPCNICMPPDTHAQLRRINLDGSGMEVIARGTRQVVGLDFHPVSHVLYFSENQRDWLSEDLPNDKLNRLQHPGKDFFGFPYCHQGDVPDPQFGWGRGCDGVTKPLAKLGPHVAPLGVRFYTGKMFPKEYHDALFIVRHGSWNKTHKIGGDIEVAWLKPDGTVKTIKPFLEGFLQDNKYIGRPVDILQMPDGALLISDDWNGAVYRLSYSTERVSSR